MDEILAAGLAALRAGKTVVVVDDDDRENEGDLVIAASAMTPEIMAFYLRHGSGIVCAPMPDGVADGLELPLMVSRNEDRHRTAFTVSVDECNVGTGISAADRAATVRALAEPGSTAEHVPPPGTCLPAAGAPRRRAEAGRAHGGLRGSAHDGRVRESGCRHHRARGR